MIKTYWAIRFTFLKQISTSMLNIIRIYILFNEKILRLILQFKAPAQKNHSLFYSFVSFFKRTYQTISKLRRIKSIAWFLFKLMNVILSLLLYFLLLTFYLFLWLMKEATPLLSGVDNFPRSIVLWCIIFWLKELNRKTIDFSMALYSWTLTKKFS